jgi:hypothetical protein
MTTAEWDASKSPLQMINALGSRAVGRKFQLFLCAAGRRLLDRNQDALLARAVANLERFVDGEVSAEAFREKENEIVGALLRDRHLRMDHGSSHFILQAILAVIGSDTQNSLRSLLDYGRLVANDAGAGGRHDFDRELCTIIRDVFPPPDRDYVQRASFAGGGLLLPDGSVFRVPDDARAIALGIRQDQAFDRLPILADALEDADCSDRAWLDHLRYGTKHGRGCWALDLALGRS